MAVRYKGKMPCIRKTGTGTIKLFREDVLQEELEYTCKKIRNKKMKYWQTMTKNLFGIWHIVVIPNVHIGEEHLK